MLNNAEVGEDMETATHHSSEARNGTETAQFPPLDRETRAAVDTETAAYHLSRKPQTLRVWACRESGPIRPLRVHGRLAWRVAELRRVLGLA